MKDRNEQILRLQLGERLKLLREQLGMTQAQLAEFLECTEETVSKAERGVCMMKYWRMIRLCRACNVTMDFLLCGIDHTDTDDVPIRVIEMYRHADPLEFRILQEHMQHAEREIARIRDLEKLYKERYNAPLHTSE